jgi:uncharacterized protein
MAKVLVLSDIHYPNTHKEVILKILEQESPDRLILLGDCVLEEAYTGEFQNFLKTIPCQDYILISGDEGSSLPGVKYYELVVNGRKFVFTHGHQFNLISEVTTKNIVRFFKAISPGLPVLGYALAARLRSRNRNAYIVLGHSHALKFFPRLRVVCAGCLTEKDNLYFDRGYVAIASDSEGAVVLSVRKINGKTSTFEI